MQKIKRLCFLGVMASFYACAATNAPHISLEEDLLNEKITRIQKESKMPGLQVTVLENGASLFSYSNGMRAAGKQIGVEPGDKWHIGSCTKPMTAFLIGRLIDEGKLSWKTKLKDIVPSKFKLHPSLKPVTIEQLLSHQSGLATVTEPEDGKLWPKLFTYDYPAKELRERLIKGLFALPTKFKPGSKFSYSNSGYVVLGWIVEHIKKQSWELFIKKDLFNSLNMTSCGFGPAGIESPTKPTQPWSHSLEGNSPKAIAPGIQADNPPALGPAGTVHCSVKDWAKFLNLFLDNQGGHSKYLSGKTYDKLLSKAGNGPYTYSSMGRKEREWANGTVFAMAGSNTMNYALVAITPKLTSVRGIM